MLAENCQNNNQTFNTIKKLEIFEDENSPGATKVDGLTYLAVGNEIEAFKWFFTGNSRRTQGAHSIFTVYISSKSHTISGGTIKNAELKFVDLTSWGTTYSENVAANSATASSTKIKAASVPSLSFLEQVIVTLKSKKPDCIPWRSCPLTHVLKGSFKRMNTVLLCTIYGDKAHLPGSLTTLRFSARLNNLPVEAAHNEVNDAQSRVQVLEEEINKLKSELKMRYVFNRANDKAVPCSNFEPLTEKDISYMTANVKEFLKQKSNHLDVLSLRHVNKLFEIMRDEYNLREAAIEEKIKAKYHLVEKNSEEGRSIGGLSSAKDGAYGGKNSDKSSNNDKKSRSGDKGDKKANKGSKGTKSSNAAPTNSSNNGNGPSGGHNDNSKTSLIANDSDNRLSGPGNSSLLSLNEGKDSGTDMIGNGEKCLDVDSCNLVEAFEDFKKNGGRNTYFNILNAKKALSVNRKAAANLAVEINSLAFGRV